MSTSGNKCTKRLHDREISENRIVKRPQFYTIQWPCAVVTMACQAAEKHPSVTECLYMHNVAKMSPKKSNFAFGFSFTSDFTKKNPKLYDGDINLTIKELANAVQLWQYGLWSFQTGDTKLERFLPKNQHMYSQEIIEF